MEIDSQIVCTETNGDTVNFTITGGLFSGVHYEVTIDPNDIAKVDYTVHNPEFVTEMIMKVLEGVIQADITKRITESLDKAESKGA